MNGLKIINSNTWTPSTLVSSGLHPTTTTSGLNTTAEELVTTVVLASTAMVNLDRTASSRLLSSRARRSLWARVQVAPSVEGMTATRGPPAKPDANAMNEDGASDAVNADTPTDAQCGRTRRRSCGFAFQADIGDLAGRVDHRLTANLRARQTNSGFCGGVGGKTLCRGSAGPEHHHFRKQPK